jgi:ribosomal-protein-alanine N-acetyltransferase
MQLWVNDEYCLTEIRCSDKATFVELLADREIYERTSRIPFPYTEQDAENWLRIVEATTEEHGEPVHFAIRDAQNLLVGCCGFDGLMVGHRAEIGYWLAKLYWGRGIMTAVVRSACEFASSRWNLVRITAHVFPFNPASARVLVKNGFECEGLLRKHAFKDGRFLDAHLYSRIL